MNTQPTLVNNIMSAISDRTHLWLSCEPRRLDMVSSKFWRRSRTFCTVRFLWDSGSAVQPGGGKKKVLNHLERQDQTQKEVAAFMWSVLLEEAKQQQHFFPEHLDSCWYYLCLDGCDRCTRHTFRSYINAIKKTHFQVWRNEANCSAFTDKVHLKNGELSSIPTHQHHDVDKD